jgi:hypothetical protein
VNVLYGAYEGAKTRAYRGRDAFGLLGTDPLPYGWTPANRSIVQLLAANLHEQGFIPAIPDVDRLFATA